MTSAGLDARSSFIASMVLIAVSIAGCGGSDSAPIGQDAPVHSINRVPTSPESSGGPTISGQAVTAATAGVAYSFQPQVSAAADENVSFTVANLPSWASFNPATGQLSGTPSAGQVGEYPGITISVTDGTHSASLPAFAITVAPANAAGAVTLSWQPPTENADGTPLVNLQGYKLQYGTASKSYATTIQIANPGLTTYVVQNLEAGTYFFAISSYNSAGQESALSAEVSTAVD